ncbi:MAG: hypothetical protein R3F25_04905 [Gammaproteobacteria bacterium]
MNLQKYKFINWVLLLFVVILTSGCFKWTRYAGDGTFVDNGLLSYANRYMVELGEIDISRVGINNYTLKGLPRATLIVYLQITEDKQNSWGEKKNYPAIVRVKLQNSKGQYLIQEESSLNQWTRSYSALDNFSHLYIRGDSDSSGSYFDSEKKDVYKLSVEILSSSFNRPTSVLLVGWTR